MNANQRRRQLENKIQASLQDLVDACSNESAVEVYGLGEALIRQHVKVAVLEAIQPGSTKESGLYEPYGDGYCRYGNLFYRLDLGTVPAEPDALCIMLLCTDKTQHGLPLSPRSVRFESAGRYREIRVCTDQVLYPRAERIAHSALVIVEAGYRFLTQFVKTRVAATQDADPAAEIHTWLRRLIPCQLANKVWPYSIVDGQGFYLLDCEAQSTALANANRRTLSTPLSPAEMFALFTTIRLPGKVTFSQKALNDDTTIERKFLRAPYARSGLQLVEQSVFLSQDHVIQPLVNEGPTLLSICYPPEIRRQVEPALKAGRHELKDIAENSRHDLKIMANRLRDHRPSKELVSQFGASMGTFSGSFVREFVAHYFGHE